MVRAIGRLQNRDRPPRVDDSGFVPFLPHFTIGEMIQSETDAGVSGAALGDLHVEGAPLQGLRLIEAAATRQQRREVLQILRKAWMTRVVGAADIDGPPQQR